MATCKANHHESALPPGVVLLGSTAPPWLQTGARWIGVVLIASVSAMRRLEIGSLGKCDIIPGFYAYVGSAFGSGGLRARIGHHLESTAEPHWHIDYLVQVATPVEVWLTTTGRKLEHRWAELLEDASGFRVPILRFGSSDHHRSRSSHLFYSKRQPSFQWFQQQVMERFEGAEVEQHITSPATEN